MPDKTNKMIRCTECGADEVIIYFSDFDKTEYRDGLCKPCDRARQLPREGEHYLDGCSECDALKTGAFGPRHVGSARCESGSLASGGRNSHCTCDTCF